jgi:hypothetical protein
LFSLREKIVIPERKERFPCREKTENKEVHGLCDASEWEKEALKPKVDAVGTGRKVPLNCLSPRPERFYASGQKTFRL